MSDRMRPIPFAQLMDWIFAEYARERSVFGMPEAKFFRGAAGRGRSLFGDPLEIPLGPAAGPHTQLAQNIIVAYLAGSRFFELKTVQILDGADLKVDKPCILVDDAGYNVEWSTELSVGQALAEYVKAWFALHLLSRELSLGSPRGFIFNMSVGYDLAGIRSPKIDGFLDDLKDAARTPIWHECGEYLQRDISRCKRLDRDFVAGISPRICRSVTLSTMHGCSPGEIEAIAGHLLGEKKLHTYVKLNPTLLGYDFVRDTLARTGYGRLSFDDHHFRRDLQMAEALPMLARLKAFAAERRLSFGVKLTNTFPVAIERNELPGGEMYLSGPALYPLTVNLAYRLAREFAGDLRISYSGGADFFHLDQLYRTGIWPITAATTLLKPGGYQRLKQMADLLADQPAIPERNGIDVEGLGRLAASAVADPMPRPARAARRRPGKPPLTDCFRAPCAQACPIGQDVPAYLRLAAEGKYREALAVITARNPLPFITGTLCNHPCMSGCTRKDYEAAVEIRAVKLLAARHAADEPAAPPALPARTDGPRIAVVGGGPTGLTAAYFLRRNGFAVTVFERREKLGGLVAHVIPRFRIPAEAIERDLASIQGTGPEFVLGAGDETITARLRSGEFKYILFAIGAWRPNPLRLETGDGKTLEALAFLERFNAGSVPALGGRVAVIGGGNSAMDAARAAVRTAGVARVWLVYRRTREYMPADREEIALALADGVEIRELLAPAAFTAGRLKCQVMELGPPDASGRRSPVPLPGRFADLPADSLIAAIGEGVEPDLLRANGIEFGADGRALADPETNETNRPNVFLGGDALRGPSSIVEGMADGLKFAETVLAREGGAIPASAQATFTGTSRIAGIVGKRGILKNCGEPEQEGARCLECDLYCNICAEVCPNRANVRIITTGEEFNCENQILHLDGLCNECGNCATFCPYEGAPYRDKFTLFRTAEDFAASRNDGFVLLDAAENRFRVRVGEKVSDVALGRDGKGEAALPDEVAELLRCVCRDYRYLL